MPVVVQIARQLYSLRLEELKRAINEDEEKFLLLISEIDDIRAGKWDNQLLGLPKDQPSTIAAVESNTNIPLKTEEISNSDQQSADEFQTDESKQEKISEEQAKVQTDNLQNETRNVRDKDTTPPPREETPTASDESFQSAIEDTESQAKKRPAEEVDDEEEPSLKRQKTDLDESIRNDYSTDVSQVTTPADTTDLRDGTESIAGSDSNATSEYKRSHKRDDPRHKSWQKNINLLWREIANHKNGAMFMNPIKESIAPHYYEIIKRPMDLKTIKNRIRDGVSKLFGR
jgi:bromodomain-containing protein 8